MTGTAPGPASRPPKTRRPWPVPRVALPAASEVMARWDSSEPSPWVDDWDDDLVGPDGVRVPAGAPGSIGSAAPGHGVRRLRWTFCTSAPGASEVLFWANRLSDETDLATTVLEQVPGTDLWAGSFVMPDDWIASYCFLVAEPGAPAPWRLGDQVSLRAALDRGTRDLRNPEVSRNRAGVLQSVVHGPGAGRTWSAADDAGPSCASGWERSALTIDGRDVVLHQPVPAADAGGLPLLVVLDGEVWEAGHGLPHTLARLVREGAVRPHRLLLVSSGGRETRWAELGGDGDDFVTWLCDVALASVVGGSLPPEQVSVAGQSLGGITALRAALERPDRVGWGLSQSASLWIDDLADRVTLGGGAGLHVSVGAQEWVLTPGHEALEESLRSAAGEGSRSIAFTRYQGGHDYAWWRHALVDALEWQESERSARQG